MISCGPRDWVSVLDSPAPRRAVLATKTIARAHEVLNHIVGGV
jgi:hypothetical protein